MKGSGTNFLAAATSLAVVATMWVLIGTPSSLTAEPLYSGWSAPVNLGAVINSSANDAGPTLSKDRLALYFGSNRSGSLGGTDIWVSQRSSVDEAWGLPTNLGAVVNSI